MGEALEARALLPGGMAQEEEAIQNRRTQKMQNKYQRDKMELGALDADMGEGAQRRCRGFCLERPLGNDDARWSLKRETKTGMLIGRGGGCCANCAAESRRYIDSDVSWFAKNMAVYSTF